MSQKIRVLIVDDHSIVRDGLKLILENQEQIEVSGEAASLAETMEIMETMNPHVVLLDFKLPDGDKLSCFGDSII